MTISASDIKLLKSDTMSDVPEGGGAMTGSVIVSGVSNAIFDDISSLSRVYGSVSLRKIFLAILSQTTDKYFGSRVIITKLPGDGKIGVNLFNTGDYFDRRPAAQSRVENYRAQGPAYNGFLWGTQYQGSRALTIFQNETAPLPGIGDVLVIVSATAHQYVRIVRMNASVHEFNDGSTTFKRRILDIEISDVLTADFVGIAMTRSDTLVPAAQLYKTVVANAARYYSARPLALAGTSGSLTVKVDSVYSQVVPSSQSEIALVDISAGSNTVPLIDAATGNVSFSTSVAFTANSTFYLGNPCFPGSLSIPVGGATLVDEGGNLKSGSTVIGTVNYAAGLLNFAASAPTYSGAKTVTFRPAAAPVRVADTASIRVTAANRGYVWTLALNPPPKPGALSVSYRALNEWYELRDNTNGGLVGQEAGIGSGSVNYVTGSVTVTTAALPDADSDIIFAWGKAADFFNRSDIVPGKMVIKHQLGDLGFIASTVEIHWENVTAKTATCSALGAISGDATGQLNVATGLIEFSTATLPLGGTVFTFTYVVGEIVTVDAAPTGSGGNVRLFDLEHTNVVPGTLKLSWTSLWEPIYAAGQRSEILGDHDDGQGNLTGPTRNAVIDYAQGKVTFDPSEPRVGKDPAYKKVSTGPNTWTVVFDHWVDAPRTSMIINNLTARFFVGNTQSTHTETLTLSTIEIDLSPGYTETIVPGSVLFGFGGHSYVERSGQLYHSIDRQTGAGTYGGTIDYSSGRCVLTNWVPGSSTAVTLQALLTTMNYQPVSSVVMRAPAAPLKSGVYQIRATPADGGGQMTATAGNDGTFVTADIDGFVEFETGVAKVRFGRMVTAAGHEGEDWFDAAAVIAGQIFKPRFVLAETIFYDTVAYSYLPLSSAILGLDPVRLPADGRVPVYAPGDVVVVLHDRTTTGTYLSGSTTDLGRGRLAKLTVRDAAGQLLDSAKYSANLDTGIIVWGSLVGVSQPLTLVDRIEDEAVVNDVQVTGTLTLSKRLTHNFPLEGTLVSNAVVYGTLYARTSIPFDQQTWTNVWSESLIGSSVVAQYNATQYPIQVDNQSCIQERWAVIFTTASLFNVIGEHVGQIMTGGSISSHTAPVNPNTNLPFFTIPATGWGNGWAAGNVLRFNTVGAHAPTWIIQAIGQGDPTSDDYTFCIEGRGDIDTP